jgi:hypothetical protein
MAVSHTNVTCRHRPSRLDGPHQPHPGLPRYSWTWRRQRRRQRPSVLQNFEISSCCEPRAGSTDAAQLPQRRRKHTCPVFVMMPLDTVFVRPAREGESGSTASDVRSSIGASVSDVQTPEALDVALRKIRQAKVQVRCAVCIHDSARYDVRDRQQLASAASPGLKRWLARAAVEAEPRQHTTLAA